MTRVLIIMGIEPRHAYGEYLPFKPLPFTYFGHTCNCLELSQQYAAHFIVKAC
jgi:hypothetical protein